MSLMDEINKVGTVILGLEQRIELFINAAAPLVTAFNPVAGAVLKEIDVALGIVAYAASKAENMQNQVNLSAISTALINNPDKAKQFLDSVILGISTVAGAVHTVTTQTTTAETVAVAAPSVLPGAPIVEQSAPQLRAISDPNNPDSN